MKKYHNNELSLAQVKADIVVAKSAIEESERMSSRSAKYIKGIAAFHLQQASEKAIKFQIYESGVKVEHHKIYKHSLDDLIDYANDLNVNVYVPQYIMKNKYSITKWEALGRYDLSAVVRLDTLKACIKVIEEWYEDLLKKYK